MQVAVMNQIELTDISKGFPQLRRFDNLKVDGHVTRPNIKAVADDDRGLCFEMPTPPTVHNVIAEGWKGMPHDARLLTADAEERNQGIEELEEMFKRSEGMQYPVLASQATPTIHLPRNLRFDYTEHALKQVSKLCGLESFKDLQREADKAPDIAAARINRWFQDPEVLNNGRKRKLEIAAHRQFVRTFIADPQMLAEAKSPWAMRAVLSDQYRVIDTTDILTVLFQLMQEKKDTFPPGQVDLKVSFDDAKCHFTLTNRSMTAATKRGQIVAASLRGGTSDIGTGSATVERRIVVLACTNGMTTGKSLSMRHLGRKNNGNNMDDDMFSERTKMMQEAVLLSELKDAMTFAFEEGVLIDTIEKMDENQDKQVDPEDAPAVFEAVRTKASLAEPVKDVLFNQFLNEHVNNVPNRSKDGVVQAVTAYGRQLSEVDYSKAMPLEDLGGKLHNMASARFDAFVKQAKSDPRKAARMI
jgi:hypothetical protein